MKDENGTLTNVILRSVCRGITKKNYVFFFLSSARIRLLLIPEKNMQLISGDKKNISIFFFYKFQEIKKHFSIYVLFCLFFSSPSIIFFQIGQKCFILSPLITFLEIC